LREQGNEKALLKKESFYTYGFDRSMVSWVMFSPLSALKGDMRQNTVTFDNMGDIIAPYMGFLEDR